MMSKDLTNRKFNKWTVLYRAGTYKKRCALWRCRCDCGFEREVRTFHLTNGYSKQCRDCADKSSAEKRVNHYDVNETNHSLWKRHVVYGAKKRGLELSVSLEEANKIFKKQKGRCSLTGLKIQFPAFRKDTSGTASLDRIDSSKGYIEGNVQWVHKDVNKMKQEFPQGRFIELCKMVAKKNEFENCLDK